MEQKGAVVHEGHEGFDDRVADPRSEGLEALEGSDLAGEPFVEELEEGLDGGLAGTGAVWQDGTCREGRRQDFEEWAPAAESPRAPSTEEILGEEPEILGRAPRRVRQLERRLAPVLEAIVPRVSRVLGVTFGDPLAEDELLFGEQAALGHGDGEGGVALEPATGWSAEDDALAEELAAQAGAAAGEIEASSLAGGLVVHLLASAPLEVKSLAPVLVRRIVRLVRLLRRSSRSRPLVLVVPAITRHTVASLMERLANGRRVSRRTASRTLAKEALRMLTRPRRAAVALTRNRILRGHLRRRLRRPSSSERLRGVASDGPWKDDDARPPAESYRRRPEPLDQPGRDDSRAPRPTRRPR